MSELKNLDESMIRVKAFELWLDRGAPLGSPENDWFSAKMLLESPEPPAVVAVSVAAGWAAEPAVIQDEPAPTSETSEKPVGTSASRAQRRTRTKSKRR